VHEALSIRVKRTENARENLVRELVLNLRLNPEAARAKAWKG
jgi:hypothetical protein